MKITNVTQLEIGQEVKVTYRSNDSYVGIVVDTNPQVNFVYMEVPSLGNERIVASVEIEHVEFLEEEKQMFELNQEVIVEMVCGFKLEGKIVDRTRAGDIWVERTSDKDCLLVSPEIDRVTIVEKVEEVAQTTKAPYGLKSITEIKSEYKKDLSELWNKDVESHNVKVFNNYDDSFNSVEDVEVWDCEFNTKMEDGERITIYFGTFYNEKDALQCAREMRTKLKRTFDIEDKVTVYTC